MPNKLSTRPEPAATAAGQGTPAAVLLVEDDHAAARRLERVLARTAWRHTTYHAQTLAQARALMVQNAFTLALVDMHLPDGSGLNLIDALAIEQPDAVTVVVSAWGDAETIVAAIRAGARGYLLKNANDDELVRALASMERGGAPMDPLVAARILAMIAATPAPGADPLSNAPSADGTLPLSERERDVLMGVARGNSNREIAAALYLSVHTVECHTRNIYRKLHVSNRTAAVAQARVIGWL